MDLCDFSFAGEEDFGLAKSFSKQPLGTIAPGITDSKVTSTEDVEREFENISHNEIKSEGFCFKLAPTED